MSMLRSRDFLRAENIDLRVVDEERYICVSPTVKVNSINMLAHLQERKKDGLVMRGHLKDS